MRRAAAESGGGGAPPAPSSFLLLGYNYSAAGLFALTASQSTGAVTPLFQALGRSAAEPPFCPPLGAGPLDGYATPGAAADGGGYLFKWREGSDTVLASVATAGGSAVRWSRRLAAGVVARLPAAAGGGLLVFLATPAGPTHAVLDKATGAVTLQGSEMNSGYELRAAAFARGGGGSGVGAVGGLAAVWESPSGTGTGSTFTVTLHPGSSPLITGLVTLVLPASAAPAPGCALGAAGATATRGSLWVHFVEYGSCAVRRDNATVAVVALGAGFGMAQLAAFVTPPFAQLVYVAPSDTVLVASRTEVRAYDGATGVQRWVRTPASDGGVLQPPGEDVWVLPPALTAAVPLLRACCPASGAGGSLSQASVEWVDASGGTAAAWALVPSLQPRLDLSFVITPSTAVVTSSSMQLSTLSASARLDAPWRVAPYPQSVLLTTYDASTLQAVHWVGDRASGAYTLVAIPLPPPATPSGSPTPSGTPTGRPSGSAGAVGAGGGGGGSRVDAGAAAGAVLAVAAVAGAAAFLLLRLRARRQRVGGLFLVATPGDGGGGGGGVANPASSARVAEIRVVAPAAAPAPSAPPAPAPAPPPLPPPPPVATAAAVGVPLGAPRAPTAAGASGRAAFAAVPVGGGGRADV